MSIKKNYVVAKRNVLNEIRANNMTLQELRFFSIYLSKINPKDTTTRVVRFPLSDFQKIMELDKLKIDYIKHVTDSLLCKIVRVPLDGRGNYTAFQLFKKCTVDEEANKAGERYVEIDAHDDALPLMFEFKNKYFTYQLWNALRLKSSNQLRMYEILKQYEQIGERIISIDELKELLSISGKEYPRYTDFKIHVLDVCQEALAKYTDISFTYESIGKKGNGGKILNLKFTIIRNDKYIDQLSLDEFINQKDIIIDNYDLKNNNLNFYAEACNNEFSISEIQVLYNLIIKILPPSSINQIEIYDYLKIKYDEMVMRSQKTTINKRFCYLKKLFETEFNE